MRYLLTPMGYHTWFVLGSVHGVSWGERPREHPRGASQGASRGASRKELPGQPPGERPGEPPREHPREHPGERPRDRPQSSLEERLLIVNWISIEYPWGSDGISIAYPLDIY